MTARILVVDNHDSFVFTVVSYLRQLGAQCEVVGNDRASTADAAMYDGVLLSPGPGAPQDAGCCVDLVRACADRGQPLLGICLGHQVLGIAYGAAVHQAPELLHGRTSSVRHAGFGVLAGLPGPFQATRYHSLAIDPISVPQELEVTATTDGGVIMAVRHRELPLEGVQFHPESVLTQGGHRLLANWLAVCGDDGAVSRAAGMADFVCR